MLVLRYLSTSIKTPNLRSPAMGIVQVATRKPKFYKIMREDADIKQMLRKRSEN